MSSPDGALIFADVIPDGAPSLSLPSSRTVRLFFVDVTPDGVPFFVDVIPDGP